MVSVKMTVIQNVYVRKVKFYWWHNKWLSILIYLLMYDDENCYKHGKAVSWCIWFSQYVKWKDSYVVCSTFANVFKRIIFFSLKTHFDAFKNVFLSVHHIFHLQLRFPSGNIGLSVLVRFVLVCYAWRLHLLLLSAVEIVPYCCNCAARP